MNFTSYLFVTMVLMQLPLEHRTATRDKTGTKPMASNEESSLTLEYATFASLSDFGAETTGFEPAEGFDPFTDLANRRFRPLSHVSGSIFIDFRQFSQIMVSIQGH